MTSLNLLELLFLVDFVTLTLSTDNVVVPKQICQWRIAPLVLVSIALGLVSLGETVGLWYVVIMGFHLGRDIRLINTASFCNDFFRGTGQLVCN